MERKQGHYRALISLGVPIIIGQVGNIVLSFADTIMVGRHSTTELASAGFINSLFMLVVIFAIGFSYGLTPIVGGMYGREEHEDIGKALKSGVVANTLLAVILLAVCALFYFNLHRLGQPEELLELMRPYLLVNIISLPFLCWLNTLKIFYDTLSDTKTSMYVLLGGNIFNILCNYLLIFGALGFPEMGLLGAGIATMLSRILMCLAAILIFLCRRKYSLYRHCFFRDAFDLPLFRQFNSIGWIIAFQMGIETCSFSLATIFVGWMGMESLAAHQIMLTVSQLFYMVYYGMAAAVCVRVSHFYGQGDVSTVKATANAGFRLILLIAVIVSIPVFLLRDEIGYWFNDSPKVALIVSETVIPLIVYQFGDGLQCTFANALRGIAHVRSMLWSAFISYVIVSLPLSWLLGIYLGWGLMGMWFAFPFCLTLAGVLYYSSFRSALQKENSLGTHVKE